MRIVAIGGSGYLGGLVLPMLAVRHTLRVFDLRPPANPGWEHIQGSIDDYDALTRAVEGMDALLYMAMGDKNYETIASITTNFDVSVKGIYLALDAARRAGVAHAVYTSSMSIYAGSLTDRYFADEELVPDSTHFYGLTKRFGEEICRNAARQWGMSVNVLRLCFPTPDQEWIATTRAGQPTLATAASDVANALLAALDLRAGFQAFMISGDYDQQLINMSKARRMLGWEPLARPAAR